ncbi:MAG TPA: hypothetical protein HA282_05610 [Nanoarchaeota archaeon]|nr:MAG: hypothetical protein QT01_C0001G0106 [archaeon GW2011_AR6]MBS3082562.1 hypothetical protein [Candidatus Pacearchaeota archaeon]HIH17477.1 hypothetical protein [Nanoarchaeota archaeon]HIH33940.1 hypothetical protein [Nanoarchaeota archaeon]HIH51769.1 hypothetical protein [Nanoarchaeota archaeon]
MLNKNLLNDKKGDVAEGMLWIPRLLFLLLPLALAVSFFIAILVSAIDVTPIEAAIFSQRAGTCFYEDVGVIDFAKIDSKELEKCLSSDAVGAKLNLTVLDASIVAKTDEFDYLEPLCVFNEEKNAPYCSKSRKYVAVNLEGTVHPGTLDIEILVKKR